MLSEFIDNKVIINDIIISKNTYSDEIIAIKCNYKKNILIKSIDKFDSIEYDIVGVDNYHLRNGISILSKFEGIKGAIFEEIWCMQDANGYFDAIQIKYSCNNSTKEIQFFVMGSTFFFYDMKRVF